MGMSIGKGGRDGNMTYSPPSNKIHHFVLRIHERAVEVIVEFLVRTNQLGFCMHTLPDSRFYPSHVASGRTCGRGRLSSGGSDKPR
jgi:hypothetical protein